MQWPVNNEAILASIHELFDAGRWWVYKGKTVAEFERRFAAAHGCEHGVSICNGTVGLDVVLRGLGIGPGDRVVLPAYNFYSLPKSVSNAGAEPVFVDVVADNLTIDAEQVRGALSPEVKAVVAVHLSSSVAQLDALQAVCDKAGVHLIEDCAQAAGATYAGRRVGSWGVAGVFSFGGTKLMTSGQGGMITTSDRELHERCHAMVNRGSDPDFQRNAHGIVGDNYQMSELAAAVLGPQLDTLTDLCARREEVMRFLDSELPSIRGLTPLRQFEGTSIRAQLRYSFLCNGARRDDLIARARAAGLPLCAGHSCVRSDARLFERYGQDQEFPAARAGQDRVVGILHTDILRGVPYWSEAMEKLRNLCDGGSV